MTIAVTSCILALLSVQGAVCSGRKDNRGPIFKTEPPSSVEFSNTSGTELRCVADGSPFPRIIWRTREGAVAADVPGLRYLRGDGTLVFPPFPRTDYRQDVHDTVYQCVATNVVGTIVSRDVHVRGVIKQRFTPQVYDDFVVRGNTAVLRCHLPSFVREHVAIDSWIRSDDQVLKINSNRARTYTVLQSGELLIHEVKERDQNWSYRCQTQHMLTGEMVVSASAGKIIVTEPHVSTLPRVTFSRSQIRAQEGSTAQLPCVAQANPPPTYRWMKDISGVLRHVATEDGSDDGRIWLNRGTLNIKRVQFSDGGQYQCIVRNSIGERRVETTLIVTAPLTAVLWPQRQVLSIGQEATFNCNVSGYPVHTVTWKRDSKPLIPDSRLRLLSRDVLHISSVRRGDKGMYQCFSHSDKDSAQGSAQLTIADVSPSIISAFIKRTVHPGEHASLKCVSTGNPVPKFSWFLDNDILEQSRRKSFGEYVTDHGHVVSHLNITEMLAEDAGEYRCEVTNEVGSAFHSARLDVYGPPFVRPMLNVTAISGKDLSIRCPYGGYPVKGIRWFKDGMLLPLNHRQKVSSAGSLTIQSVQRAADEGQYSCVVRNDDGSLSASGKTYASVVVSPVIDTRYFLESVTANEHSRIKLMCTVVEGDPPLRFHWLKNSHPFLAHGDTTVQTFEDSSIITFKRISANDRGLYTCVVSNVASSANMTTQLIVNVSPQWTVEPKNATAVLGGTVWLDCATTGFPTPSTLWKKLIYSDSAAGDFTYVNSSPRAHRYNNGTLVISEIEESDAGSYLCQASNGIGAGLSKIVSLTVLIPPRFQDPYQSRTVVEDSNASLKCIATGDPPIDITWQKNKDRLNFGQGERFSVRSRSGKNETTSELHILAAKRDDTGMYTCSATSEFGKDEAVLQLIVQGRPDPPTNISVTNFTSRSISLRWEIEHNGNSHITGSVVQYKSDTDSAWRGQTSQLIVSGAEAIATLRGLSPVTTYYIRIFSENALGRSKPSDIINVTTDEEAPSAAPQDVRVHSTGAQSMKVLWKPPPDETHNGLIRGYYVGYRQASSSDPYHYKKVQRTDDSEQQSTYITGLKAFTKYEIVVKAYNSAGTGPKSTKVVGKTLETAPPTSPIVQVKSATSNSIEISWEKDAKDKSAITDYTLHYKTDDGEWRHQRLSNANDHFVLRNVKCGTRYHLYMTASNSLGTGEPSVPVTVKTSGAAPIPPHSSVFLHTNDTSVALRLNKWQDAGCPIEYFVVQYRPKYQNQWTKISEKLRAPIEYFVIRNLSPDREYVMVVSSYNDAGKTQKEYEFRTMPEAQSSVPTSFPSYGKRETDLPFYKNVALVIPVVVSSLVLIIVVFTVVVCLRRHSHERRRRLECDSRKSCSDALMMSDINSKIGKKSSIISSHYVNPSGNKAEYAEPYTSNISRQSSDGLFATIKRHPGRPIYTSASYKQDMNSATQQQENIPPQLPPEKWSTQSSSAHMPTR